MVVIAANYKKTIETMVDGKYDSNGIGRNTCTIRKPWQSIRMVGINNDGDKDVIATTYGCDTHDTGPHTGGKIMIKGLETHTGVL